MTCIAQLESLDNILAKAQFHATLVNYNVAIRRMERFRSVTQASSGEWINNVCI
jgi:hypothetical protein